MNSAVSKSTQSLTTAEDMRNQTKLIMQPYANWEEYLTPAPLSIAILGELVFISSTTDFSISKNLPKEGYKFIKYPESFRACLMQVCNSGWWAFNEAHKSMDQIRLHTAQVPDYMKTAVKILFQGDDDVVKAHLPDQLDNIKDIADECLKLSNTAETRFTDVISIIQELLEACINAEHFYGEEMATIKKKIEENNLRKQSAEEAKKMTKKAADALEKQLGEAQQSYKNAIESLPTGWDMIGMDIVGGIAQSCTDLVTGLVPAVVKMQNPLFAAVTTAADTVSHSNVARKEKINFQESPRDTINETGIYCKSSLILNYVQKIEQAMDVKSKADDINWTQLYDQKSKTTKTEYIKGQLQDISRGLMQIPDCPPKKEAQDLCKMGIDICNQLAIYAPDGQCDKEKSTEIKNQLFDLILLAHVFDSKSKNITNSPAIYPKPPMMYREEKSAKLLQTPSENARFAIEQTRAQLNKTNEAYEKCMENLQKNQKELTEVLISLRNCELKEIDFKTTIEMLVKGMDAMGRVKEQWEKMVRFFQMVSSIVKISLSKTLTNFVSSSEKTQRLPYNAKLFSKDLLYTQAFQASNIASLVQMISATYVDVSNKYLMDRVSSLGKLMAMDKSKPDFENERMQLQNGCDQAQKDILKLVLKNKEEFDKKSAARLDRIDRELLAILPAAPPEEIKSIKVAVQDAFTEEEENAYS